VGKCTEGSPGAVAGVLNVVALGGLVDLGMELLLCPVNQKNYQLFKKKLIHFPRRIWYFY
jgi:hypothetical protein